MYNVKRHWVRWQTTRRKTVSVTLARESSAVFDDVHHHGERALKAGDFKTLGDAIAVERRLIQGQREAIYARIDGFRSAP